MKTSGFLRNSECEIQSTEVWSGTWMFCENFVFFVVFCCCEIPMQNVKVCLWFRRINSRVCAGSSDLVLFLS